LLNWVLLLDCDDIDGGDKVFKHICSRLLSVIEGNFIIGS